MKQPKRYEPSFMIIFVGTPDVDCPTKNPQEPFGLCCFDGCQNTCLPVCETIWKDVPKYDTVQRCTYSTHDVCHPETTQKCEEKCTEVVVMTPTEIMVPHCTDKVTQECRDVTNWVSYLQTAGPVESLWSLREFTLTVVLKPPGFFNLIPLLSYCNL